MHARKLGFTVLLSSIAALQLGGCRGLNPTTDLIQVTQDQNAEVATIESVAQRLNSPANESTKDPGTIDPIQQRLAAQAERVKRRREELMSANRAPNPNAKKVAKTSDKKSAPVSMSISDAFATISSETTKPKAETAKADSPKPAVASSPAPAATEKNDMHITLTDDMFTDDKPPVATPASRRALRCACACRAPPRRRRRVPLKPRGRRSCSGRCLSPRRPQLSMLKQPRTARPRRRRSGAAGRALSTAARRNAFRGFRARPRRPRQGAAPQKEWGFVTQQEPWRMATSRAGSRCVLSWTLGQLRTPLWTPCKWPRSRQARHRQSST